MMNLNKSQELSREALTVLAYRKLYEKYRYYIPNGGCEQFIALVGSGDVFVALFSAANGVGKTACGVNIVAHILYECNCSWFNYPLFKNFSFLKKGRIISDPTTITQKIVPELKLWLPLSRYTTSNERKNYDYKWKSDTGFEFDLMSYEQETKEFEAVDLGWAYFDEPPPEAIYKATVARMRRGGVIFITATPLTGSAWLYDSFITSSSRIV